MDTEKDTQELPQTNCTGIFLPKDENGWDNHNLGKNDEHDSRLCGIGSWRPKWIQRFASKQAFLFVFSISWVIQGMISTYVVSIMTTLEKVFNLRSIHIGIILSSAEIGQTVAAFSVTYFASYGHRPRWIAFGMFLVGLSSMLSVSPHFFFESPTEMFYDFSDENNTTGAVPNVCGVHPTDGIIIKDKCSANDKLEFSKTYVTMGLFILSMFCTGVGQTAVNTLGIPYIDDNVKSKESPVYFGITIAVKILGPALGFILGSFCTRIYTDLSPSDLQLSDPRWVGAWWLGFFIIATLTVLPILCLSLFPQTLNNNNGIQKKIAHSAKNKGANFSRTVKRLFKNDFLMCRTASYVLHILPISGVFAFLPKYMESHFRLSASAASFFSGVGGISVMGIGIIISSLVILRFRPGARMISGWIAFCAILFATGSIGLMLLSCPTNDYFGSHGVLSNDLQVNLECSTSCVCNPEEFSPICGNNGVTYYSACQAGCTNTTLRSGMIVQYSGCSCMDTLPNSEQVGSVGACTVDCDKSLYIYVILFSTLVFFHSTTEVGSVLLTLRCVDPRDKAMALGIIQFAIAIFGYTPCSLIYGGIVDFACSIRETSCDGAGACLLYESDTYRILFHGFTAFFFILAFIFDVMLWVKSSRVNFDVEEVLSQEEELNLSTGLKRTQSK